MLEIQQLLVCAVLRMMSFEDVLPAESLLIQPICVLWQRLAYTLTKEHRWQVGEVPSRPITGAISPYPCGQRGTKADKKCELRSERKEHVILFQEPLSPIVQV